MAHAGKLGNGEARVESNVPNTKPPIIELKNGKLILRQKIFSLEKLSETMQEIVNFRQMIEERIQHKETPLDIIPDEHHPLIAKLVHESDKTLPALSRHVQSQLLPVSDDEDEADDALAILSLSAVESAIRHVASRNDYGLDAMPGLGKRPAAFHVWKWEIKDEYKDWVPKQVREKAEARHAERLQAKREFNAHFASLSDEERNAILSGKGGVKAPLTAKSNENSADQSLVIDVTDTDVKSIPLSEKSMASTEEDATVDKPENGKKGSGRPKKLTDPERAAKEKERQEKKAAREEKEKRAKEAQDKSRWIMASFFGKAKPPSIKRSFTMTKDASPDVSRPSAISDFEKTFKSFVLKKDVELAPINWFTAKGTASKGKQRMEGNVIVLDEFEEPANAEMTNVQSSIDVRRSSAKERSLDFLSHLPPSLNSNGRRRIRPSHMKTYVCQSIRDILSQLNEAEVTGDDVQVRKLLFSLRNRTVIPAKVLIFAEDARPGYFGTWTRSSREIGPRTPFARDVISIDYAYDSGEEWEEESGDADDVVEDAEEEEVADEEDSDLDDWLVDDGEVEDPGTPIDEREASPDFFPIETDLPKRKAGGESSRQSKKRKVVVPLVPFTKGPYWEEAIGHCSYEPFQIYRIQLFNDTPLSIDPFTFVSASMDEPLATGKSNRAATESHFAVPALPSHVSGTDSSVTSSAGVSMVTKRAAIAPRTSFPEAHLPLLLTRISTLSTSSLAYIVETVHQELREQRVKKNAIEAKVREVGEKCKTQKIWVVKPDVKARFTFTQQYPEPYCSFGS
ncbi:uncharacterized protein LAESUDRAFT_740995 [Laetiporus sulphureus 93-53]|uniref:Chromatin assembly factor 1 subunit A dimerization domain-containing protein n=1 Tax=Laetiporus sulphureus 93-53 TaxID=1314785 RepID=A0A165HC54_9APHY|nr:uncharacterized protein LAESUDRAFT_740995 [Laetiporus sulphureus 93-53]KZT11534.1 hypothetical protein LAESUDRAFT_740995 [Laetiporus sulphureus 93-53]